MWRLSVYLVRQSNAIQYIGIFLQLRFFLGVFSKYYIKIISRITCKHPFSLYKMEELPPSQQNLLIDKTRTVHSVEDSFFFLAKSKCMETVW